jgi:hypothetical protein
MRGLMSNSELSLETIALQSGAFFKELTLACVAVRALPAKDMQESSEVMALSKIVKHRTNLTVTFVVGDQGPSAEFPRVDRNHPLLSDARRNWVDNAEGLKMIAQADGLAKGLVNITRSWVDGVFADMPCVVHMPVAMFTGTKFSVEELAAIILHELGHLFTYCEYMNRTTATNQVLAGLAKSLDASAGVEDREVVLLSAKKALRLNDLDVKELAKSKNKMVVEAVILTSSVRASVHELGSNVYDLNSWEQLSDAFAARHGAARPLITALDRVLRDARHSSFRSTPVFLGLEALKLVLLIAPLFMSGSGFAIAVTKDLMIKFGLILIAVDQHDDTYDRPGARIQRVRNDIVQCLKDRTLPKATQQALTEDLVVIDEILQGVNDRRQLLSVLVDAIVPSARRAYSQERLQRELEDLAANDLFLKAAELKQLA